MCSRATLQEVEYQASSITSSMPLSHWSQLTIVAKHDNAKPADRERMGAAVIADRPANAEFASQDSRTELNVEDHLGVNALFCIFVSCSRSGRKGI